MKKKSSPFLIIGLCAVLTIAVLVGFSFYKSRSTYIPSKALKAMPDPSKSHYIKGKEYYYKREFDNAISEFKKSIKIKPTPQAHGELAVSYMEKEDFKIAIENLKASIDLDPKYPKAQYAMAVCYTRINPPDVKSARRHFEKAKKLGYQPPDWFEKFLSKLERKE